jgi:hypothetical protein
MAVAISVWILQGRMREGEEGEATAKVVSLHTYAHPSLSWSARHCKLAKHSFVI